jgi:UDP-N-acetylglucosamine 2-epimerase
MRVLTVVGARPQFIKAAPVSAALAAAGHEETLVHTGQHYAAEMSDVFFGELGLRPPDVNLAVGSGAHGWQTGTMLVGLEREMTDRRPDVVVVYGDTNSTLAGALAAVKLGIPLAHVEAGLRSWNRTMPEEHNRIVADHCADLLLCPTETAVRNLEREGLAGRARLVGDTMYDAVLRFREAAAARDGVLGTLGLAAGEYHLATLHRPYNVDVPERLRDLLDGLVALGEPVVWPVHPRTRARIEELAPAETGEVRMVPPVGYLDMLQLEQGARTVLTDSGGVQKEAFFLGVPCVTLRPETEWVETVAAGWNVLAEGTVEGIGATVRGFREAPPTGRRDAFGDGDAAARIVREIAAALGGGR